MLEIDSHTYSLSVSLSVATMMYLRITPFCDSGGGGFQLRLTVVESMTSPVKFTGASLGPSEFDIFKRKNIKVQTHYIHPFEL